MSATTKIWQNNSAPSVEDVDLNGFKSENNNLIEGSGQVLNTGDNQQTHKAVANYASAGDFFIDSGATNTYLLGAIAPRVPPPEDLDGMVVRFIPSASNTAAATVNLAGLGAKSILRLGGAPLEPGDIAQQVSLQFDFANDRFILLGTAEISTELVALTARVAALETYLQTTGGANAYAIAGYSPDLEDIDNIRFSAANTGPSTLNGTTIVNKDGSALIGTEILGVHRIRWDGTNFVILDPQPTVTGTIFRGCLAYPSSDLAGASSRTPIPMDTEDYDTDNFHSTTVNTSRFTIPPGVSRVRLTGQVTIAMGGVGGTGNAIITKNGSQNYPGVGWAIIDSPGIGQGMTVHTAVVSVIAGDYFELEHFSGNTRPVLGFNNQTWLCLEVVE